jgi:hypothetical protein
MSVNDFIMNLQYKKKNDQYEKNNSTKKINFNKIIF